MPRIRLGTSNQRSSKVRESRSIDKSWNSMAKSLLTTTLHSNRSESQIKPTSLSNLFVCQLRLRQWMERLLMLWLTPMIISPTSNVNSKRTLAFHPRTKVSTWMGTNWKILGQSLEILESKLVLSLIWNLRLWMSMLRLLMERQLKYKWKHQTAQRISKQRLL